MALVSIIMPISNRADTIRRAIRSVQSQTFTDWELIVVDDGTTDNTVALIEGIDDLKLKNFRSIDSIAGFIARRAAVVEAA